MIRIGNSIDIHRFGSERDLKLGGITIDYHRGLVGHSDGDVFLHAVAEALIGAMGFGDLGEWFSDQDAKYKNIDSSLLLKDVLQIMRREAYEIINIDSLILCEEPYLKDYKPQIRENVAKICNIDSSQINVKATRPEKLGALGDKQGIMVLVTILIKKESMK